MSDCALQANNNACVNYRVIVQMRQGEPLGAQKARGACLFGHYDLMMVVCLCFSCCPGERIPGGFNIAAALFNVPGMYCGRSGL